MGRTWPNLDADPVERPGYYWNERLRKLARLQLGEKLPRQVGPWEFVAAEHEATSSQVARRLFDRYPGMTLDEFTYTTTTPLDRRLPIGDHPRGAGKVGARAALLALGALALASLGCAAAGRRGRCFG